MQYHMCNFRFIVWREPLFHQIFGGHLGFLAAILEKSWFFFIFLNHLQKFFQHAKIENATSKTKKKSVLTPMSPLKENWLISQLVQLVDNTQKKKIGAKSLLLPWFLTKWKMGQKCPYLHFFGVYISISLFSIWPFRSRLGF